MGDALQECGQKVAKNCSLDLDMCWFALNKIIVEIHRPGFGAENTFRQCLRIWRVRPVTASALKLQKPREGAALPTTRLQVCRDTIKEGHCHQNQVFGKQTANRTSHLSESRGACWANPAITWHHDWSYHQLVPHRNVDVSFTPSGQTSCTSRNVAGLAIPLNMLCPV